MQKIDENRIKEVLGSHRELLQELRKRILMLQDEIMDTDSILKAVSMKKLNLHSGGGGGQGGQHQDMLDAMIKHQQMERRYAIELSNEIYRLVEEEESINRIMVCFRALRGKEYTYIRRLYVEKEPYKAVEQESGVSHSRFESIRTDGLKQIQSLYESRLSNVSIMGNAEKRKPCRKKKKEGAGEFEQLSLGL